LRRQNWDVVVMDESHNLSNVETMNNTLARLPARTLRYALTLLEGGY
jgi:hypothetical protein